MKLTREEIILMLDIIEKDKTPAAHTWRFDDITNLSNKLKDELKAGMTTQEIINEIQGFNCVEKINISNKFENVVIRLENPTNNEFRAISELSEKLDCPSEVQAKYTQDYSSHIEFDYNEPEKDLQDCTVKELIERVQNLRAEIEQITKLINL